MEILGMRLDLRGSPQSVIFIDFVFIGEYLEENCSEGTNIDLDSEPQGFEY
jgi:hypothetical protein